MNRFEMGESRREEYRVEVLMIQEESRDWKRSIVWREKRKGKEEVKEKQRKGVGRAGGASVIYRQLVALRSTQLCLCLHSAHFFVILFNTVFIIYIYYLSLFL